MNDNGFILISRRLLTWKYHDFPEAVTIWIHILLMANWKDGYFQGEKIERGELVTSVSHLMQATGIKSNNTIRKWLKRFESDGMIELKTTNRFTSIKVIKYMFFQDLPNGYAQPGAQLGAQLGAQPGAHNRTKQQGNKATMQQDKEKERDKRDKAGRFVPPSTSEVTDYAHEIGFDSLNAQYFLDYYESKGWMIGKNHMKSWKAAVRTWKTRNQGKEANHAEPERKSEESEYTPEALRRAGFSPIESADDFERVFGVTLTDEERNIGKK